jgi:hypothetical protein
MTSLTFQLDSWRHLTLWSEPTLPDGYLSSFQLHFLPVELVALCTTKDAL